MRPWLVTLLATASICTMTAADSTFISATDPVFTISGAAISELSTTGEVSARRFHRPIDMPGKGYGWDNPGTTVAFRSAARSGSVRLRYSAAHVSTSARNGIGLLVVDDAWRTATTFKDGNAAVVRPITTIDVPLPVPTATGEHRYCVVLPYGDSVEFLGATVASGATLTDDTQPPRPRWVAYGDSVTQGFDASHVGTGYTWQASQLRGWELLNLGLGGRVCTPGDAAAIAGLAPDLVTLAIGVNDWQGGIPPATYGQHLGQLLDQVHALRGTARIAVISPLWVGDDWKPAGARAPLADYRSAAAATVAARPWAQYVNGPDLIAPDRTLFNRTAVHPNDRGFAQMAEQLATRLFPPAAP
jgi:lysophospholipase L1-like esterase